jgi:hypothetical protein
MDQPSTQSPIKVIKPGGGSRFELPKFKMKPLWIGIATVLLAIVTVASALLLYQNREESVIPTPTSASTTTTLNSDFSSANWVLTQPASGQISKSTTSITITDASTSAYAEYSEVNTGDFQIDVRVAIGPSGTNTGSIRYGTTSAVTNQSANLRLTRIGDLVQSFVDTGSGYQLVNTVSYASDDQIQLEGSGNVVFDNFSAKVNLVGSPTPIPGTAAACTTTFTVLDIVPTSTPGPSLTPTMTPTGTIAPSATPTQTPTVTPTNPPGPTSTPIPLPTPASCNNSCSTNADCTSGLTCSGGLCRNPQCTGQTNCNCVTSTPVPTPVTLEKAGSVNATWIVGIGGIILLGLGSLLLFSL